MPLPCANSASGAVSGDVGQSSGAKISKSDGRMPWKHGQASSVSIAAGRPSGMTSNGPSGAGPGTAQSRAGPIAAHTIGSPSVGSMMPPVLSASDVDVDVSSATAVVLVVSVVTSPPVDVAAGPVVTAVSVIEATAATSARQAGRTAPSSAA